MSRWSALALLLVAACESGATAPPECRKRLSPSANDQMTVQSALLAAASGDVLCFDDGTYHFTDELSLQVSNVKLRGTFEGAVWDFKGQVSGGNGLSVLANGFTMTDLTIKNTKGDGIRTTGSDGVTFQRVKVSWDAGSSDKNGAYALYPVASKNVLIDHCEVVGASDAGIYVGQSQHIIVSNNEVHGNVAGIEIENSKDAEVHDNHAYDNTAGILVFNLPGLPVKDGMRTRVYNNVSENNNRFNFASGGIVAFVPNGIGLMVMAVKQVEVSGNTLRGNESTGAMVISFQTSGMPINDPLYDPYVESVWLHDNLFSMNGTMPQTLLLLTRQPMLEDILWDGRVDPAKSDPDGALRICLTSNGSATFRMVDSEHNYMTQSTDAAPHNCTHPALPPL